MGRGGGRRGEEGAAGGGHRAGANGRGGEVAAPVVLRQSDVFAGMDVRFFGSQLELHEWLEENHDKARELWIGFYKRGSNDIGITYAQALDEALCFGWIDGVRKGIDQASYTIR